MIRYFYDHIVPERRGNLYWNNAFCIVPSKDGFILLTLLQQWETLVEWMESEGMAEDLIDEKWKNEEYRHLHRDRIVEVVQRWTKTHTTSELFELGQLMHFPWAPVYPLKEVLESPQLRARGYFMDMGHPEINASLRYPRLPYKFSSVSLKRWRRAPLIGEDNTQIFQGELGLSKEEMEMLSSEGAI
jgi:crotonobetainyl-CoA:carnitine CoA-transferase CaiB-like acyl-CoA transferase